MSEQLIVAGFHRSGTSLVCQLLSRAGLFLGYDLLGADASNLHGHFEEFEIMDLHKQILVDNGLTWQIDAPVSPEITEDHRRWMERIVQRRNAEQNLWGFKDPRVCLFLPTWKRMLPDAKVLLVYRHPSDSAYSLSKRHSTALFAGQGTRELHLRFWQEPDLALKMWLVHNEALLAFAHAHPEDVLAVSHDSLQGGFPVVGAIQRCFGFDLFDVSTSEVFDPTVTDRRPGKQPVSDVALIERIEATWQALEQLGERTGREMGEPTVPRSLSKGDFYKPTGVDDLRLENELLTLGMRYLEDQVTRVEQSPASPGHAESGKEGVSESKRALENGRREPTDGPAGEPPDRPSLEATVAKVADLRDRIVCGREARIAELMDPLVVANEEKNRRIAEVEVLVRWIEKLNLAVSALLNSSRWKIGNAIGETLRRITFRSRVPMAEDQLRTVMEELRARAEKVETARPASRDTSPQTLAAIPPAAPLRSDSPRRGAGGEEHILDALRGLRPVTVIVPIHNAREDLEKFLRSAVSNTTAPAELLLIDDASTDPQMPTLLAGYEGLENVRVLRNEENLGFSGTVNRGFAESAGDVVTINSDTEVTPRWLENMSLAAYADPRTATVTAISDKAGAFSVPNIGKENDVPEGLERDEVGRLVMQRSGQVYPQTPTGNGFCMYVKRAALDDVGPFDAESFPRGYGEENDFCMRAKKLGWNHVVDDVTFVFHKRSASFGDEKKELLETVSKKLDELHPEYAQLAQAFVSSENMRAVGTNVRDAYLSVRDGRSRILPRVLFVLHDSGGGTLYTSLDLMNALSDRYSPYLLVSDMLRLRLFQLTPEGALDLVEERSLDSEWEPTEFSRPDYRSIVFDLLVEYRFELVHVRHLFGHTFDLPEIASRLGVPVVLSFHDFYYSCPTVQLIDDNGKHCGGICTPGTGRQCTILTPPLKKLPILKHAWLKTWRWQVERMFENVDVFVTTSQAAKEIYLRSLPGLHDRPFELIEHGRDLEQEHLAVPPGEGPIRVLIPGNINFHKGANFIRELQEQDQEGRIEFHFLGNITREFKDIGLNRGVNHGVYAREEFADRVREISPSFMGIFSITPETYCHALTEAWAVGVPVLASDIGTLRERVDAHGGGWLIDHEDPKRAYERILEIAADSAAYARELQRANLHGIRSTREMSDDYQNLYEAVLRDRRQFTPTGKISALP